MAEESLTFNDVKFHIKEFEHKRIYILGGCYLVFYKPYHLATRDKENGKEFKSKNGKEIHKEQEIIKINSQEEKERNSQEGQENIDKEINALAENTYRENIKTQTRQERQNKFKDYDIFYDVYTSKGSKYESVNKQIGFNPDGFEIKNGIAEVEADFFQKCFQKGIYHLIPRLVSNKQADKDKDLHFDPVPLEDKGFVITDFHNAKQRTLTFQRRIAEVKNPDLTLQTPKEFLESLSPSKEFDENKDKLAQAKATQKACELRVSEMEKILGKKMSKEEVEERIKELSKRRKTKEERNELTRLEFLQMNKNKAERYGGIVKNLGKNQRHKPIYSKDIGDTGECLASLLFDKKSTRYLSNQRKLDANFNTKGFNHTIPDFLVTLNDYPTLIEVKNVQVQSLTEQISFELKLAREYELDYVFLCNHYTKLTDNIAGEVLSKREHEELAQDKEGVKAFNEETQRTLNDLKKKIKNQKKENQDWSEYDKLKTSRLRVFSEEGGDRDARSGFIYHRHLHRSIKTIFKEIYLHHIKGAAPNKIMVKRLDLNDATQIEEELNKDQNIQQCGE